MKKININENNICCKCNRKWSFFKIVSIEKEEGLQELQIKTICCKCKLKDIVKQTETSET